MNNSIVKSNVLVMNVTPNGIVCTVESSRTEDAVLCFLSYERAALLDIVVPTKAATWAGFKPAAKLVDNAFANYSRANVQIVPKELVTYDLLKDDAPWMVKSTPRPGKPTPTPRQWQGVKEA
jgi:hypothetical protein